MTQNVLRLAPILVFFLGCHHSPSPTGLDALPGGDLLGVLSFDSQRDSATTSVSTAQHKVTGGNSQFLSIGRSSEYTCAALVRWIEFPATINEGGRIVSAKLTLYAAPYGIGNLAAPVSFDVREVTSYWSSHTYTSDSMRAGTILTSPGSKGRFSGIVGDSIEIALDSSMVRNWLRLMADGRYAEIRGLLLDPDAGSTSIRAFESSDVRPSSTGLNPRGPKLTLVMDLGTGRDSTISASSIEDTYALMTNNPVPSGLVVAGGVSYRGNLTFDVSRIPAGSIVNNVALYLSLDEAACKRPYRGFDSVYVFESLSGDKDSTAVYAVTTRRDDGGRLKAEGGPTLPLVRAVQRWVNNPGVNHGLVLIKIDESSDLDYLAFHGPAAAEDKRPRLVVTYSQRP